jgi:flagellin-like hook-associated protein FlgL
VDVSGLTLAGGTQTVSISSTAKFSIDDGATSVESDLTDGNLAVTDSRNGGILYVDTRQVARFGTDPVRIPGTNDLFSTLISVRDLMANDRDLSTSDQLRLLNEAVKSMDEVTGTLTQNLVIVGGRLQANESLRNSMEEIQATSKDETSKLQDADLVALAMQIARSQNMYEMTLASAAKLLNLSLLDFLGVTA